MKRKHFEKMEVTDGPNAWRQVVWNMIVDERYRPLTEAIAERKRRSLARAERNAATRGDSYE